MNRQTFHIGEVNWTSELAQTISSAKENAIIVVDSHSKREIALRAIQRMRPNSRIEVQVC